MTVTLTPEQMRWIEAAVAAGEFPSVEDAVRVAIADLKLSVELGDLSWAKPYIDKAREDIEQGRVVDGDEIVAWLDGRIEALRSR